MSIHWKPAVCELSKGVRGLSLSDVGEHTAATSGRMAAPEGAEEALVTPIYHTSTYKIPSVDHYLKMLKDGGSIYVRLGNPTCEAAEAAINALEGGAGAMVFCSGMAAISTAMMTFLKAGDHVIACNPLYSGTHHFLSSFLTNFNIEYSWVPQGDGVEGYRKLVKPNTKLLYGETPCNPLISILDLEEFGKLGRSLDGVMTMVDSTYGSPTVQKPHKYDIDIVAHSGTKYLGGHSDLLAGVISTRTEQQWQQLNQWRTTIGTVLSPHDASLLLRGVKTLPLRMERHCENAQKVAEFLAAEDKVETVYYPGLSTHPGHDVAARQMNGFGGMVAFEMKGGLEPARTLVENVRLIQLAVSLGGVESLIEHPATMTHGPMLMSDAQRQEGCIYDGLVRLSVGLEDAADLINDLRYALGKITV